MTWLDETLAKERFVRSVDRFFDGRYEVQPKWRWPFALARLVVLGLFAYYLWRIDGWRAVEVSVAYSTVNIILYLWNKSVQDGEPR